ncbi:MAG: TIGR00725 family protein [Desulfobacteraceae bacterium]|nr:TIGR00725 family protein [Desulfobacteraceae bacterium]
MGGGDVDETTAESAYELGTLIARNGWVLLNGGRNAGVMQASAKGAAAAGGLTIGILPDDHKGRASEFIRIPILTGMGHARNIINILSSDVVVACAGGAGTISEIAIAVKQSKPLILLNFMINDMVGENVAKGRVFSVRTPAQAIAKIRTILNIPG